MLAHAKPNDSIIVQVSKLAINKWTHSFSRSSGVSLGVPMVLTSLWNVDTAVLIWKMPEATAWVGSCLPLMRSRLDWPDPRPPSRSWKLISVPSQTLTLNTFFPRKIPTRITRKWEESLAFGHRDLETSMAIKN